MTLRCAILDDFAGVSLTLADWSVLADVTPVVFTSHFDSEDDLVAAIGDCEIVVTLRERVAFPASVLSRLPKLRLLVATGMRNTVIDYAAASARGVVVSGTGGSSDSAIEMTWALLLGIARSLPTEASAIRSNGPWQSTVGVDLHGRTLGLLGLGRIGTRVAEIGRAFGMDVLAWSRSLTPARAEELGIRYADSLDTVMAGSDFVSVHVTLTDATRGLVGASSLALMRPSAYLINTARAAVVDQDALLAALHAGAIAGAAVDVFDIEPLPAGHPMRTAPRLLATPHIGYVSQDNLTTFYAEAIEDIRAFLDGHPVRLLG